jgi:hypothetical protein
MALQPIERGCKRRNDRFWVNMMTQGGNGSYNERFWDQIDHRLKRIEDAIDNLAKEHGSRHERLTERVNKLETNNAQQVGGWKVVTIMGSVAGAIGGLAVKWFG